jgi:hypothetical protein
VKRGGVLIYQADYCKHKSLSVGRVSRTLVDGMLYNLPETYGTLEAGCHKVNVAIQIPKAIPAGTYYLRIVSTYEVNKLRDASPMVVTDNFKITE